ncbi:MAG: NADPH-dependent glutamate synthase [Elusimicrobia bacterium]|nr:NADPH-dependent glutamate synthase [Elusimicrobiota bacterium]MBD3412205.1 NADPH-dependent glutamate synthase [Elusimicrobiota bacterium]
MMHMKKKNQVRMPEQPADIRRTNFDEVPCGLSEEEALYEAGRCIQCKNPTCRKGCPVNIDIKAFIKLITEKKYIEAARKIKEQNALPAVCGRVCPQEDQCEKACVLHAKRNPIAIGYLERFVADYEQRSNEVFVPAINKESGKKIAVVGSGPSGLTCAGELRLLGHEVHIFEALHKPGGVLSYGIPEFRLPKSIIDQEVDYLTRMGVRMHYNAVIGKIKTIEELFKKGFHAVYIATGAGYPQFMNIPGEHLNYVYSANEFLTRVNLMKAYQFPQMSTPVEVGKRTAVIGGGNTAMDAARSALRLGGNKVCVIYRRSEKEMPARIEEIRHAHEEGIEFIFLAAPVAYIGDEHNRIRAIRCIRMKLGEPDQSGRKKPLPVPGSEFEISVDSVIIAVGTRANPIVPESTSGLQCSNKGYIIADAAGATSLPNVYAGGDIVSGSATVIKAMGAGKTSAKTIDEMLKKLE